MLPRAVLLFLMAFCATCADAAGTFLLIGGSALSWWSLLTSSSFLLPGIVNVYKRFDQFKWRYHYVYRTPKPHWWETQWWLSISVTFAFVYAFYTSLAAYYPTQVMMAYLIGVPYSHVCTVLFLLPACINYVLNYTVNLLRLGSYLRMISRMRMKADIKGVMSLWEEIVYGSVIAYLTYIYAKRTYNNNLFMLLHLFVMSESYTAAFWNPSLLLMVTFIGLMRLGDLLSFSIRVRWWLSCGANIKWQEVMDPRWLYLSFGVLVRAVFRIRASDKISPTPSEDLFLWLSTVASDLDSLGVLPVDDLYEPDEQKAVKP